MPNTYLPVIDYTARTYPTIKAALLTHVRNFFPNDFQDFQECLSGSTKIPLLNGTECSIKELFEIGGKFEIYTYDAASESITRAFATAHKTRLNAVVVKVVLDNGESIVATPDHLFMRRNGEYCRADLLKPNDSLMPLYRRISRTPYCSLDGYEQVLQPNKNWDYTHRFGIECPPGFVRHHRNFDKRDNTLHNISIVESTAHSKFHGDILTNYNKSVKHRKSASESTKRRQSLGGDLYDYVRSEANKESCRRRFLDLEVQNKLKKGLKEKPEAEQRRRKNIAQTLKHLYAIGKRSSAPVIHSLKAKAKDPSSNFYKYIHSGKSAVNLHNEDVQLCRYCGLKQATGKHLRVAHGCSMKEYAVNYQLQDNHKVVKVELIDQREDTYCLCVQGTENFALASGVFVHNSNLGVCILELVAYVGDNLSFYLDRTANEMFLATAQQRQNIINLARLIGYNPATAAASSASIRAVLSVALPDACIIPAYTSFVDKNSTIFEFLENIEIAAGVVDTVAQTTTGEVIGTGNGSTAVFSFVTADDNLVPATLVVTCKIGGTTYNVTAATDGTISLPFGGTGLVDYETGTGTLTFITPSIPDNATNITLTYDWNQTIVAYQGKTRLDQFSSTGLPNQEWDLTNSSVLISPLIPDSTPPLDPNRFEVWIGDPGAPFGVSGGVLWTRVDTLVSAVSTDTVYQVLIDDQDMVSVLFGDGSNGAIPTSGTGNINIIYRTGGGLEGNIAVNFIDVSVTGMAGLLAVTVRLNNYEKGSGGAERETADEIRINAPAYLRTNDTATTEEDYDTLASQYSQSGSGAVATAKARLTPDVTFIAKTVHSNYLLGVIPATPVLEYYLLLPATPVILSTVSVIYTVSGIDRTVIATDLGSGLAQLSGDASIDAANTRFRYTQQDYVAESPTGFLGNGATVNFVGILAGFPVLPGNAFINYTIGGVSYLGYDNGVGKFVGSSINSGISTINYATGAVNITFTIAPDSVTLPTLITFDYQSCLRLVLVLPPDAGTDILANMDTGPSTKNLPSNNVEVYTWSYDSAGALTTSGDSLKDSLKAYLDLRRVLGTSVQVLDGFNVGVNVYLEVDFNTIVSSSDTTARIVTALETYFETISSVRPGEDVPLAGIYNAVYPLYGVDAVVVTDLSLRVPIATGDGFHHVYRDSADPGEHVSTGKLPALKGIGNISIYQDATSIGSNIDANTQTNLTGTGVLAGSYFHTTSGDFFIKLAAILPRSSRLYVDFYLDSVAGGMALWNSTVETWEIATLGNIYVNNVLVN